MTEDLLMAYAAEHLPPPGPDYSVASVINIGTRVEKLKGVKVVFNLILTSPYRPNEKILNCSVGVHDLLGFIYERTSQHPSD